jgi:ABC-type nitrate/sulfonate/bicarbonate transport system ATPase subunit
VAALILEVKIERKCFGSGAAEQVVLAGIEFSLGEGEIIALVGPSGCGKTTLLKIVGGLDSGFAGRVQWLGAKPPRIGTIFQNPRLLPWRTVRQNLLLVEPPGGVQAIDDLLRVLGLWPFRNLYPPQISLGMARRVAIVRAFAIVPDLVLLDEPFVSLDPAMAERGREVLLDAWRRRPTSALLVTHDLLDAAALADRMVLLSASPSRIVQTITIDPELRRSGIEVSMQVALKLRAAQATA